MNNKITAIYTQCEEFTSDELQRLISELETLEETVSIEEHKMMMKLQYES